MSSESPFKRLLKTLKPGLDASLDPICLVDAQNRLQYVNLGMKNLLAMGGRDMKKAPVFCDLFKLAACEKSCQVLHAIQTGEVVRLDETPAAVGPDKKRVLFKVTPLEDPDDATQTIGALVTVRDTTGEILLQAKYHKMMTLLEERDDKIRALTDQLAAIREALRRARSNAAA